MRSQQGGSDVAPQRHGEASMPMPLVFGGRASSTYFVARRSAYRVSLMTKQEVKSAFALCSESDREAFARSVILKVDS